jgi:hypothetical protein
MLDEFLDVFDSVVFKRGAVEPLGDLREEALHAHNVVRANHKNTEPLTYDYGLADDAQAYALVLANGAPFQHSNNLGSNGENLYKINGNTVHGFDEAAYFWYREIKDYDYSSPWLYNSFGAEGVGHFTQMVWASTKRVGCAGAKDARNAAAGRVGSYYVCRYAPGGNVMGDFGTQVHPVIDPTKIPRSPLAYQLSSSNVQIASKVSSKNNKSDKECKDQIPDYCKGISQSQCVSAGFKEFNQKNCAKSCGMC